MKDIILPLIKFIYLILVSERILFIWIFIFKGDMVKRRIITRSFNIWLFIRETVVIPFVKSNKMFIKIYRSWLFKYLSIITDIK